MDANTTGPWLEKWEIKSPLSGGGQGTTFLVQNKLDREVNGVMKVLKRQRDGQARRRMYQEVSILKVLQDAKGKVPKIMDSNAELFADEGLDLYFVMEFIPGHSIDKMISEAGPIALQEATEIIFDLAKTLKLAFENDIIHRDLKPENIIVKSRQPADAVIVDYGLSYNTDSNDGLTRTSETIDNSFLSLPERRIPDGNRRDPRSDITSLCGLLYFCLSGKPPVDLVGPSSEAPHKRLTGIERQRIGDENTLKRLELFFDRGFSSSLDNRYQGLDEMVERLKDVISPSSRQVVESLQEVAKKAAARILHGDRKTQIVTFQNNSGVVLQSINQRIQLIAQQIQPFGITRVSPALNLNYEETESVLNDEIRLFYQTFDRACVGLNYQVRAKGDQCVVLRSMLMFRGSNDQKPNIIDPWTVVFWYNGYQPPASELLKILADDFEASASIAIQRLPDGILGK